MKRPLSPERRETYRGLNGGPVSAPCQQSLRTTLALAALPAVLVAAGAFPAATAIALVALGGLVALGDPVAALC